MAFPGGPDSKDPPAMLGDLGLEDPVEEDMATLSSIPARRSPMDRGAWPGYRPCGVTEWDTTEHLSTAQHIE